MVKAKGFIKSELLITLKKERPPDRQPLNYGFEITYCFFKASRISVRSSTSGVGFGGAGSGAASFFFR